MTKLEELEKVLEHAKKMKLQLAFGSISKLIAVEAAIQSDLPSKKTHLKQKALCVKSHLKSCHDQQKQLKVAQKLADQTWAKSRDVPEFRDASLSLIKKIQNNRNEIAKGLKELSSLELQIKTINATLRGTKT
jgi:hypothetical protein